MAMALAAGRPSRRERLSVRVLVVNAGSSGVKLSLLGDGDETIASREIRAEAAKADERALIDALRSEFAQADAVGHRIVHGGERYRDAVRVDAGVEEDLRALCDLAPLHQPKSIAALDAVAKQLPCIPAVACFDTAFHATLPPAARTYAVPEEWSERLRLRRYGFHGLSHGWIAKRVPELLEREAAGLRIVSCHLGAGASVCAIRDGRSLDTTMGFTPQEGLVMATRSGSVDPGMLVWLLQRGETTPSGLADALEHRSGLLGLCGSADMREVLLRADAGEQRATLALDVYLHSLRAGIAAMTAALGGLDALAFTGGVGERSAAIRERAVEGLGFLGLAIDGDRNGAAGGDDDVSVSPEGTRTLVVAAREDREIARQVRATLASAPPG
jgi:acetate kinase